MQAVINDTMYLHNLFSLSTLTVPLQVPETWVAGDWSKEIDLNVCVSDVFFPVPF